MDSESDQYCDYGDLHLSPMQFAIIQILESPTPDYSALALLLTSDNPEERIWAEQILKEWKCQTL